MIFRKKAFLFSTGYLLGNCFRGIHLLSFFWSYFPGLRHEDRSWVLTRYHSSGTNCEFASNWNFLRVVKNTACTFLCVYAEGGVFFFLFLDSFKRSLKPTLRSYKANLIIGHILQFVQFGGLWPAGCNLVFCPSSSSASSGFQRLESTST